MVDEDCEFEVSQEVTGQPGHLLPVPLPDDGVLQLGKRPSEDCQVFAGGEEVEDDLPCSGSLPPLFTF